MEPFSRPRDIIYVVVAPDNEFVLQHVQSFFRELSTVYELCRLGRHVPFKPLRDGIMRIGKNTAQIVSQKPVEDWFNLIGKCRAVACVLAFVFCVVSRNECSLQNVSH